MFIIIQDKFLNKRNCHTIDEAGVVSILLSYFSLFLKHSTIWMLWHDGFKGKKNIVENMILLISLKCYIASQQGNGLH